MVDDTDAYVPDFEAARDHVITEVIRFTRRLRRKGVRLSTDASLDGAEALATMGIGDEDRVRDALRASLVTDRDDVETFDEEFPRFWARLRAGLREMATEQTYADRASEEGHHSTVPVERTATVSCDTERDSELDLGDFGDRLSGTSSDRLPKATEELQMSKYSPDGVRSRTELEEAGHVIDEDVLAAFERALSRLPGRRRSPSVTGDRLDVRRTLRENVQTGGIAFDLPRRKPRTSELKACVLVDVSRSVLDTIDREFLLAFLDRLHDRNRAVRTFIFDTDIREVTALFEASDESPETAFERAGVEWGGGTRIGKSLATLRREWPYAVDGRTALLVVSDGLDVGEVETLESEMAYLSKRASSVLWLNPLAASPEYEPICRGMSAALPYVDGLFAFTGTDDLAETTRQLERHGVHGSIGYEYDRRRRAGTEN